LTDLQVSVPEDGEMLRPATVYIVSAGRHALVRTTDGSARIALADTAPLHGVRPAADPLMMSVAEAFGSRSVGVVLTGMGSDGAQGSVAIREAGGEVIVQDEETSTVWGMPQAALDAGAARRAVPLSVVPVEIRRAVRAREVG
jgi:two-component system chemotaxis response regulator CheB